MIYAVTEMTFDKDISNTKSLSGLDKKYNLVNKVTYR